ncbi:hypothetical protein JY651_30350 [Pyxidicoccus parkwayensis]|uniref:Lipoprotein n=1 Tax=Pyxidicoccus parkwayensis TaxID=2813578 RepID=A0ABX7NMG8_9BACT|nr:hypothetical protein [Pyxidicoccus parkwaysis]QSQ19603.1 hypothetical protein JY651_30350 [Pyxidicoccus parkwaysis]
MHTWQFLSLAAFLCLTGTGCAESESAWAAERGAMQEERPAESDSRSETFDFGNETGEEPAESESESDPSESEGESDSEAPGSGPVRISGAMRDLTKEEEEDEEAHPWFFPPRSLNLFVRQQGSFVPMHGAPGAAGDYVFGKVPDGPYYLREGDNVLVTRARKVDLGVDKLLRDGIVDLDTDSLVRVRLDSLEPWHDRFGDSGEHGPPYSDVQLVSEQLGFGTSLVLYDMHEGATSADEESVLFVARRIEAERGDTLRLVQHAPRELCLLPGGGVQRYSTAVRALHLPPLSHDGTEVLNIEGTLAPLPQHELALDWRLSAFTALAADVHPEAVCAASRLAMRPSSPEPCTVGWMGFLGELMSMSVGHDAPERLSGTVRYGNPSRTRTGVVARAATTFAVAVQTPDGVAFHLTASVFVQDRPGNLSGRPLLPRIQPPRGLTLDGTEAYSSRVVDDGAHVIGWQSPEGGAPDVYLLRLQRIDLEDPTHPQPVPVAQFYVDGDATSVRLPAEFMEPGNHYSLTVEAVVSDGYAVWNRPLMLNDRYIVSRAAALCGLLSVAPRAS